MAAGWDVVEAEVSSVDHDPATRETRVRVSSGALLVVKGTQALRVPSPLPVGELARIVGASRVVQGEAAVLTLSLSSGQTVQVVGTGLALRAA
jgi:hypothetical protein